ncbi:hypothetical protein Ancab_037930 [Ancistrocladus abbreviatus]
MESEEKGGERKDDGEEFMGIKLKRGLLVGKRGGGGGPRTPPPTWTFRPSDELSLRPTSSSSSLSARQLAATLWEILPHLHSIATMNTNGSRLRRRHHHHLHNQHTNHKNKGLQIQPVLEDPHESDNPSEDQPGSTGSFHRQIAESLIRHHRSVNRNVCALQPVSPASYSSSMEVTPYNAAITPSSSLELKGKIGEPSYSLKTSTELLKILNRIWSLEEQHRSNVSLVKTLKMELDNSRSRVKDLLKEKQMDRQVIDDLMKQISEDKLSRRNMEQDRIKSALQSAREEVEVERQLRKRSESLHRKLARELSEMKSSFNKVLNDLERERKARNLLEDLCDEFAVGIRDYEHELRSLKYKTEKDQVCREHVDSLVLHISEAWLDERMQMKLAGKQCDDAEKNMIVDKLSCEIESFLKAKKNDLLHTKEAKQNCLRRHSLESFHLNEAASAPQNPDDDEDSIDSDSNCFELNKTVGINNVNNEDNREGASLEDTVKKQPVSQEANKGRGLSSLQARFLQHMARTNGKTQLKTESEKRVEAEMYQKPDIQEDAVDGLRERKSKRFGSRAVEANHILDNLLRNNSSSLDGDKIHPETTLSDVSHNNFLLAVPASPVKKWESNIIQDPVDISESYSKGSRGLKENTLKAKLLEARLEGRQPHLKAPKGSS